MKYFILFWCRIYEDDTGLAKELQRTRLIVWYNVFAIELCPIAKEQSYLADRWEGIFFYGYIKGKKNVIFT